MSQNDSNNARGGCLPALIMIIALFLFIGGCSACVGGGRSDFTEDGQRRCNFCSRPAEHVFDGKYYCDKHVDQAVENYLDVNGWDT